MEQLRVDAIISVKSIKNISLCTQQSALHNTHQAFCMMPEAVNKAVNNHHQMAPPRSHSHLQKPRTIFSFSS